LTKINKKALVVIKQKFQDGKFIAIEGAIYKRFEIQGGTINIGKVNGYV